MGEDSHLRVYLKSKKDGKYINAHEVCAWDPKYSMFEDFIKDRNYDLFSLFGSRRGTYKELSGANYGLPDFLKDTIFEEYCIKCGFYGFTWYKVDELRKAIVKYLEDLKRPDKYLDEDNDSRLDWEELIRPGLKDEDTINKILEWHETWLRDNEDMIRKLENILDQLERFKEASQDSTVYSKLFDFNETVFLIFFDN